MYSFFKTSSVGWKALGLTTWLLVNSMWSFGLVRDQMSIVANYQKEPVNVLPDGENSPFLINTVLCGEEDPETNVINVYWKDVLVKELLGNVDQDASAGLVRLTDQAVMKTGLVSDMILFSFETPGDYLLKIEAKQSGQSEVSSCGHADHEKLFLIHVLPYRIEYRFAEITFSETLAGGKEMSGAIMSVPVAVSLYREGENSVFQVNMVASGVEANMTGELREHLQISNSGSYTLKFLLKGKVATGTYVMFDFMDRQGVSMSHYYPNPIH